MPPIPYPTYLTTTLQDGVLKMLHVMQVPGPLENPDLLYASVDAVAGQVHRTFRLAMESDVLPEIRRQACNTKWIMLYVQREDLANIHILIIMHCAQSALHG